MGGVNTGEERKEEGEEKREQSDSGGRQNREQIVCVEESRSED